MPAYHLVDVVLLDAYVEVKRRLWSCPTMHMEREKGRTRESRKRRKKTRIVRKRQKEKEKRREKRRV